MQTLDLLCNTILRAVVNASRAKLTGMPDTGLKAASEIMKAEVKSFLFGDEYKNERECVLAGTVHQNTVVASVVASCVNKINKL